MKNKKKTMKTEYSDINSKTTRAQILDLKWLE